MSDTRQSDIHESIATERERDHYKAALERIAGGEPYASLIAREALDSYEPRYATAEELIAEAETVEPGLGAVTEADQAARREALKADRRAVDHADAQGGGEF